MERRDFIKDCTIFCAGGIGVSMLLQSCGTVYYATSNLESNKIKINKTEFFDDKKNEREFIIVRSEKLQFPVSIYKKNEEYVALYMQCTHQGCELRPNKISLVCPCHGSEFSTSGKVLNHPADKDLQQFKVTSDYESIYVEL